MEETLRPMRETEHELARVDELLALAYGTGSRRPDLDLYQATQPDGWYVIEQGAELLAAAGCLVYGSFCWLGLVATHPEARGRGLASRISGHLVEWALARGCRTVALDASILGRPVYERLGFQQIGGTAELLRPSGSARPPGARAEPASADDLDEIVAFDREAFGGDRAPLLTRLTRQASGTWHVTRAEDGALTGYLLARAQLIGPAAAIDEPAARQLVRAALEETRAQRVLVPVGSAFLDTLGALGFVEQRRLAHMRLGDLELPGARSRLIAQLGYATG